ncbi:TRAP transporter substrate-binding protein [Ammoniphilus resinae]|uniref:Tripartite ATP-independent transporter DctP family solute receptor n=1 Tax=Ammoniphilus resinae TaxID=861532 RepID=A0ABS4GSL2_9BACL|nr:TRAP transporter substrate-binding protein [Ammoniphilus resinae]MBP1933256.1 tripartite ATP-independent transporter DctP family solute receptor [Ammoniphilus resinae]
MKKLKWMPLFTIVTSFFLIVGCSTSNTSSNTTNNTDNVANSKNTNEGSAKEGTPKPKITLQFGNIYNEDHPSGKAALKFIELVKEKTNGEVAIEHFPSEQLGSESEMLESVKMGALDMSISGTGIAGKFQKQYQIFPLVYITKDMEQLNHIMNSPLGEEMANKFLEENGARVLASNWIREPRVLFGTKPVKTLEDLKGFRIRVPEQPVWIKSWERLGASPTPIALGELYTSIDSGIIDGAETGISYYSSNGFQNIAPYVMLTDHVFETNLVVMNENVFQKLSPENQKAVIGAAKEAGEYHIELVEKSVDEQLEKLKNEGVTVIDVDRDKWIQKVDGLGLELEDLWGKGLYEKFKSYQ